MPTPALDFRVCYAKIIWMKGFSLVEISIVVLIASMAVLVVAPVFRDAVPGARIESSARRLSAAVDRLYNEAVFSGSAHSLVINLEGGSYEGEREAEGSEPEKLQGVGGRLLEGVFFLDGQSAGRSFAGGQARINFSPDGVADPSIIRIENQDGRIISLVIEGFTGRVKVVEGYHRESFR